MKISRRTFVAAAAGLAGALAGPAHFAFSAATPQPLSDEDGYKLWLRYAPPPAPAVDTYRRALKQIVVEGNSLTAEITGAAN